jgi:hypothetical protein
MVDQFCAGDWVYGDIDWADAAGADAECLFQLVSNRTNYEYVFCKRRRFTTAHFRKKMGRLFRKRVGFAIAEREGVRAVA